MTTWDRALYQGRELPPSPAAPARKPRLRHHRRAHPRHHGPRSGSVTGSASRSSPRRLTGTMWMYEGSALGARVVHFYFPGSGLIIAVAANSSTDPTDTADQLPDLAVTVYQTLQKAGAVPTG